MKISIDLVLSRTALASRPAALTLLALVMISPLLWPTSCSALPVFAREYHVPCSACHTVAPALNANGLAFQASLFNWAAADAAGKSRVLPVSAMATASSIIDESSHKSLTDFRTLELFATDGFTVHGLQRGGYFLDDIAAVTDQRGGALDNAFVEFPIAGDHSQLSVTIGQMSAMRYQWDQINSLSTAAPAVFGSAVDAFSFGTTTPAVELDYFDNRMKGTANGNYLTVGVPFQGRLDLNQDAHLGGTRGVFAHAFTRRSEGTLGAYGYVRDSNYLYGFAATLTPKSGPNLLAAASTGHDEFGTSVLASVEADQQVSERVALTFRVDHSQQPFLLTRTYPVAAITYYPFTPEILRLSAEYSNAAEAHTLSIYARAQF